MPTQQFIQCHVYECSPFFGCHFNFVIGQVDNYSLFSKEVAQLRIGYWTMENCGVEIIIMRTCIWLGNCPFSKQEYKFVDMHIQVKYQGLFVLCFKCPFITDFKLVDLYMTKDVYVQVYCICIRIYIYIYIYIDKYIYIYIYIYIYHVNHKKYGHLSCI